MRPRIRCKFQRYVDCLYLCFLYNLLPFSLAYIFLYYLLTLFTFNLA